jgi:predicted RNA binding protein YcfA (HicA-like mRNA interferase family)
VVKVRDMLKRLAEDGWVIVRQRGSHRQLQHPIKPGTVTVSGHPSETLRPGTYASVLDKAILEDQR